MCPARRWPLAALLLGAAVAVAAVVVGGRSGGTTAIPAAHAEGAVGDAYWSQVAGQGQPLTGKIREYYISAEPVTWDYAPDGRDQSEGAPFDEDDRVFVGRGPGRIGDTYRKCLYVGYTDATFTTRQFRPKQDRYLGALGPVIHAEVGDTIRVVYRNRCPFPTSIHPHNVYYDKNSEGAPYGDGTGGADRRDDAVPTGQVRTVTWEVPERAGPGPGDGSSVMAMYHSHTDEVADTYAGLMGPMVVTRKGMAREDGSPSDVDRELFMDFTVMDENSSPLLGENIRRYVARGERRAIPPDEFEESNLMHSINGYVYGNMPTPAIRTGDRVRWYMMGMGTEVDLHTPHWHGNTVVSMGMRMDVVDLLPATMVVADMVPDNAGVWFLHCHVNDHIEAGMSTRYRVVAGVGGAS